MLILLVEGDADYAEIMVRVLERESHHVLAATDAATALRCLEANAPDIVLLEAALPDGSGLDLIARLRARRPHLPAILVSSRTRIAEVVAGLDAGADDYVAKPFHPSELAARIRAVVRRGRAPAPERPEPGALSLYGFQLDPINQSAALNGVNLLCTRLEFQILRVLAEHPGQVLSHAFLTERIWGYTNVGDATLLRARISAIRRKIRAAGGDEEMVRTVHGVGYSLNPGESRNVPAPDAASTEHPSCV